MSQPGVRVRAPLRWDLFCRVVDNLGDAAIMWRLARQLALEQGGNVRLFIDQPAVLQRLMPDAIEAVAIHLLDDDDPCVAPKADVVVCGFHAALPPAYRRRMTAGRPLWINLEYLSAEAWIDDFHGLPSPQPDGLIQHYFYPGFTVRSGGLIRESDLLDRRDAFIADPHSAGRFLSALGVPRMPGWTVASLLCYPDSPLEALATNLAGSTAQLQLIVPGSAGGPIDVDRLQGLAGGRLRIEVVPFLPQYDYDQLLWSCDLNFVRGEDSWIRAIWSDRPFVWQIYRQTEAAHLPKLEAFLAMLAPSPGDAFRWWNDVAGADPQALIRLIADPAAFSPSRQGLAQLSAQTDLAARLMAFAATIRH